MPNCRSGLAFSNLEEPDQSTEKLCLNLCDPGLGFSELSGMAAHLLRITDYSDDSLCLAKRSIIAVPLSPTRERG